jgi:hypothetical protein
LNDWHRAGYGGPCPPVGRHRYFFKLSALDTRLPGLHRPTKADLEREMQGHVLAHAQLVGPTRSTKEGPGEAIRAPAWALARTTERRHAKTNHP